MRRPFLIAVVAMLGACASIAYAQTPSVERQVNAAPGRDVRVGIYTAIKPDCTSGPLPGIRLVTAPVHGAVSVKRATLKATNLKQCLAIEVPALVAFYHAAADFSGTDAFDLEISTVAGGKQIERVRVNVSANGRAQQGI